MSIRGESFGKELEERTARKEAPRDGVASDGGAKGGGEATIAIDRMYRLRGGAFDGHVR